MSSQKTAIITGGSKGIGAAIAKMFAENGYFVVVAARHDSSLTKTLGRNSSFVEADVRKKTDHQKIVQTALRLTKRVDVYINGAGVSQWRPVAEVDEIFWKETLETNLMGTFWGCQAAAEALKPEGSILNLSSLAGKRGSSNNSVYCASKFGVNGLTQALAKELGPRGIRVNAVCPVYVETPMILESLKNPNSPAGGKNVQSYLKDFAETNAALKRLPLAEEVAQTCLFLASPAASAITGQCINVDCGVLPQ